MRNSSMAWNSRLRASHATYDNLFITHSLTIASTVIKCVSMKQTFIHIFCHTRTDYDSKRMPLHSYSVTLFIHLFFQFMYVIIRNSVRWMNIFGWTNTCSYITRENDEQMVRIVAYIDWANILHYLYIIYSYWYYWTRSAFAWRKASLAPCTWQEWHTGL